MTEQSDSFEAALQDLYKLLERHFENGLDKLSLANELEVVRKAHRREVRRAVESFAESVKYILSDRAGVTWMDEVIDAREFINAELAKWEGGDA